MKDQNQQATPMQHAKSLEKTANDPATQKAQDDWDKEVSPETQRAALKTLLAQKMKASPPTSPDSKLPPEPQPENFDTEEAFAEAKAGWLHRVAPLLSLSKGSHKK